MLRNSLAVLAVGVVLVASLTGVAIAQDDISFVRGEPDLDVSVPDETLQPGSTTQLVFQIDNDGEIEAGATANREIVTNARAVTVELEDADPIIVETNRQSIGTVPDGEVREVPVTVTVPEDVDSGEYSADVKIRYSHTFLYSPNAGAVQERTRTVTRSIDLEVDDGPRFEIRALDSDVRIGGSGTLRAEVRNVGGETARDITVVLNSSSPDLTLGQTSQNTARIGELAPGENVTLLYDAAVRSDISRRNLTLTGQVQYTDTNGVAGRETGFSIGIRPTSEQQFAISVDESTLRVGETGAIHGTIRNQGPADVTDVELVAEGGQFEARSPAYSVGQLAENESVAFQFRGIVPSEADAVPQRINIATRFRTPADNERSTADSIHVPVADRRDAVVVTAIDRQFVASESGVLKLEVTNQRDVEIRDIQLNINVQEPLQNDFRSTVIQSLKPGETSQIAFDLDVDSDAPSSRYPAIVEVEYTNQDDELVTARPSTVPIRVTEAEGVALLSIEMVIFAVLLILVGLVLAWLYRR